MQIKKVTKIDRKNINPTLTEHVEEIDGQEMLYIPADTYFYRVYTGDNGYDSYGGIVRAKNRKHAEDILLEDSLFKGCHREDIELRRITDIYK